MGAGYSSLLRTNFPVTSGENLQPTVSAGDRSIETFRQIATTVFGYNAAFLVKPTGELALQADEETSRRFKWVRPLLLPLLRDLEEKLTGFLRRRHLLRNRAGSNLCG